MECGSLLLLWFGGPPLFCACPIAPEVAEDRQHQSGRGLPHSKTLRVLSSILHFLFLLAVCGAEAGNGGALFLLQGATKFGKRDVL